VQAIATVIRVFDERGEDNVPGGLELPARLKR
jgi:hypothetical protein